MLLINKQQKKALDQVGLLKYKRTGGIQQDQNFMVTNRTGKSNRKSYYVMEDFDVLAFLEVYDSLNLQKISASQFNKLREQKLLNDYNVQHHGEYVPRAVCFIDGSGQCRIKKDPKLMIALGIWKTRN